MCDVTLRTFGYPNSSPPTLLAHHLSIWETINFEASMFGASTKKGGIV